MTSDDLWTIYQRGLFPMVEDGEVYLVRPEKRGLMPIQGIRVSRSLARTIRRGLYTVTFDAAFTQVMLGCQNREETWIGDSFIPAYSQCHAEGWGHSCEVWAEGELAGGVYGLALGATFCAESMFSHRRDASKVALWALVNHCQGLGFRQFDCQMLNPHTESLGGYEIPSKEYMREFRRLLSVQTDWSRCP